MRPIFIVIALDSGADLTGKLIDRITSIRVTDAEGFESDTLEIELDDRAQQTQLPETGERLRVMMGYAGGNVQVIGDFVVDELGLSGPPLIMTISGKGTDMLGGIKAPRTQSRDENAQSYGSLAQKIASEHGLTANIHPEAFGIQITHIDQLAESNMALLERLALMFDMTLKLSADTLTLRPHAARINADQTELHATDLTSYQWRGKSRTKYSAVRAHYYDTDKAERIPVVLGDASAGPVLDLRHDARDEQEAARLAKTRLNQMARGTGSLTLDIPGNPSLRAGVHIHISGLSEPVGGAWCVDRVTHAIDASGYKTILECIPLDGDTPK